ncbi:hypothetical protein L6452_37840 [Arctium lappa]|uniref:Uncharacterized protein n=1 Tax=Arctium lappa TaxID=4217 RepID=A0ACB8Y576_ARCLA|nr:hypothetical protein L6452_37840 [Arctium lappa]
MSRNFGLFLCCKLICISNHKLLEIGLWLQTFYFCSTRSTLTMSIARGLFLSLLLSLAFTAYAKTHYHEFKVQEQAARRLCRNHRIVTVNGQFPGPTLDVQNGDSLVVKVTNAAPYNVTIHWHGVRQLRNPWADGPEFVTQCPIRPGGSYTYRFTITDQEGTLWWHAHSRWLRSTVYGALVIRPKSGSSYPFPTPKIEFPVILGEWWDRKVISVLRQALFTGAAPNVSDALTINGQPGDLFRCSTQGTTKLTGFGNFNPSSDPANFNLVDPPQRNTIDVPVGGWAAIRFVADNPGVWFMHCHIDTHLAWGFAMGFIVQNGVGESQTLLPPPSDLPQC